MTVNVILGRGGNPSTHTDNEGLYRLLEYLRYTIVVAGVTSLTDNSGGTADTSTYALVAVPALTAYASAGTDLAQKAEFETALGEIKNALKTVSTRVNTLLTASGLSTITYSAGGTDGAGTVAAITINLTAVAASGVATAGANTAISLFASILKTLATDVNRACTACGVDPVDVSLVTQTSGASYYGSAASTDTGTASTTVSVEETDAEAALTALADNIATVIAKIDVLASGTPALDVVMQ